VLAAGVFISSRVNSTYHTRTGRGTGVCRVIHIYFLYQTSLQILDVRFMTLVSTGNCVVLL